MMDTRDIAFEQEGTINKIKCLTEAVSWMAEGPTLVSTLIEEIHNELVQLGKQNDQLRGRSNPSANCISRN